jgi:hypothetical protein
MLKWIFIILAHRNNSLWGRHVASLRHINLILSQPAKKSNICDIHKVIVNLIIMASKVFNLNFMDLEYSKFTGS